MPTKEHALLKYVGSLWRRTIVVYAIIAILYGAFLVIFALSVLIMKNRGFKSLSTRIMFITTVISFLLSTMGLSAFIAHFDIQIKGVLVNTVEEGVTLGALNAINTKVFALDQIEHWTFFLQPIISDGIAIWRAWVLFPEQQWVMIGPCALLLGSAVTSLAQAILAARFSLNLASQTTTTIINRLFIAFLCLSLVTNALTTLLILYKLCTHLRIMRDLKLPRKSSAVQRAMVTLIESGLLYFFVQLVNFILNMIPVDTRAGGPTVIFVGALQAITRTLVGMFPSIVFVLVGLRQSMDEIFEFTTRVGSEMTTERHATAGHLSFASPPSTRGALERSIE